MEFCRPGYRVHRIIGGSELSRLYCTMIWSFLNFFFFLGRHIAYIDITRAMFSKIDVSMFLNILRSLNTCVSVSSCSDNKLSLLLELMVSVSKKNSYERKNEKKWKWKNFFSTRGYQWLGSPWYNVNLNPNVKVWPSTKDWTLQLQ